MTRWQLPAAGSVLVVGDLILDEYLRGAVSRISPEAPVPVIDSAATAQAMGGAANVAHNLRSLGCDVSLCGMVGEDAAGEALLALLQARGINTEGVLRVAGRPTTHKLRVVSQVQHLLRIDREVKDPLPVHVQTQAQQFVAQRLHQVRGIICSDYKKGMLSEGFLKEILRTAAEAQVPVAVDPKGTEYSRYRGAHVLTPNIHEVEHATGISVRTSADLDQAAEQLLQSTRARGLLITCGKDGMVLYQPGTQKVRIAAEAREVFDVTGAGDTVMATLALSYFNGGNLEDAARLANTAAGIVVAKLGTATVSRAELTDAWETRQGAGTSKIMALETAQSLCLRAQARGRRVVCTNGCFDLLHAGHVQYLQAAKALGDVLFVGLNTDNSVRGLKGPERPLVPEAERAMVLAALACVDGVVLFDEPSPAALMQALQPDILVKGADYRGKEVVGREVVEARGGRVALVELLQGQSTSGLVQTILRRYGHKA